METNTYKIENEIVNFNNISIKNNLKTCDVKESNKRTIFEKILKKDLVIKEKGNNQVINFIKLNNFLIHLCFCFVRKIKNENNVLLNEAMNIISEKLDILNLFRNICLQENYQKKNRK